MMRKSKVLLDHDLLKFIVTELERKHLPTRVRRAFIDEESNMVFVVSCLMRDRSYSRMQHKTPFTAQMTS